MRLWVIALVPLAACVFSDDDEPADPFCGDGIVDSATFEECDDGNDVADDGCTACRVDVVTRMVNVTWTFKALATNSETGCPVGFDTAEVSTVQVDADGVPLAAERIDPFMCSLGAAGIPFEVDANGGRIETRVRFVDEVSGDVYAETLTETTDISAMDQAVDFVVFDDAGYLQLQWKLSGMTSGTELGCAGSGIDTIEVTSMNAMHTYVDRFGCDDPGGITGGVLEGVYTVTVVAKAGETELATATLPTRVVGDRNRVTPLGVIDLVVPGM